MELPLEEDIQAGLGKGSGRKEDGGHGHLGPTQPKRSPSPVPSCVSMKSDKSKDLPLNFGAGDVPAGQSYPPGPLNMEMQQVHRSHLLKKFQCLMEGITHQGNPTLLRKIYTDLYITQGGRGAVNDEHEVRQIERASWRKAVSDDHEITQEGVSDYAWGEKDSFDIWRDEHFDFIKEGGGVNEGHKDRQIERASWREAACDRPIKCNDIFKPLYPQHKSFKTVLTKGVAGIGKTVSVQKFILDWAEGEANQDVSFMFPLPFRELNLMKEEKLSLVDLMQHFFSGTTDPTAFTTSEHRVMFIFDGLDECRLPLDFRSNPKCCDVTESVPVDVLLTNLIKGNLLPSALIWITTRPAAAGQIPCKCVDQVTEIRGFNDPHKEEYFRKKLSDENLASRIITHLKSSRSLYIMCHIPVFCWIAATVVERTSNESGSGEMPRTLTQMYTHFLIIQISIKNSKYTEQEERDEEMIFKLAKLAFQQLEKGNLIFYEEDLRECGIDVTEASVYSGVCTLIFREESGLYQGKVFSFVHLSIQEFLAALYVSLCFSNRERNMPDQHQTSQLSALFRATTLHDLHKTAVDLAIQHKKGHLDLFLRFLLGLSLESNQSLLRHLLPQTSSQSQSSEQTVQLVKENIRNQNKSDRINLFYCLNELNQHAVVEHTGRSSGTLSVVMLLPGEWRTGEFKFKTSKEYLDEFDLQKYIKTPEKDQTELLSPDKVLQKLMPSDLFTSSKSAMLQFCPLTEKSCSYLASVLTSHSSSLTQLQLRNNNLQDSGVELLCSALCHPNCKLEKLQLDACPLTEKSCSYLASVLTSHSSSLTQLQLTGAYWEETPDLEEALEWATKAPLVILSSSAGCHPDCKPWELRVQDFILTEEICSCLLSALTSHTSTLSVERLWIMGEGERLCSALSHPNCRLEKLTLDNCPLTEKSCSDLASVLTSHSSTLTQLELRNNKLQDSEVGLLCSALCHPNCKLEKLQLYGILTEKSCSCLASVLTSHSSSLTQLELSYSHLHDSGVELLCSALCHPDCKLEKLQLVRCPLTEKSCSYLASVLTSHSSSLTQLELAVKEQMGLHGHPTQKSCSYALSILTSFSSDLTLLELKDNYVQDSGVKLLCSALCHPNCTLEKLKLYECLLTEKSCSCLASVLTSHSSSLTQLELRDTIRGESAFKKLCALQNDPHYQVKISSLRFDTSMWWLHLSCKVLQDSGVRTLSAHRQQQSQEVYDDIFLKESPAAASTSSPHSSDAAAAAAASTSSPHSSDAAELHLTHNTQQHPGAQLLSLHTPKQGRNCQSCAHLLDAVHWVVVRPSISLEGGVCVYSLSSPAGSYECHESGLRWSCAGPVTLQYRFGKEELFWAQLQMLRYQPAGPLLEIKLLSGELEEVHLPHSLCLGGSDPSVLGDAVRALHGDDSGVSLETCELSRFHGRLLAQHFSLWQLVVTLGFPVKSHCEVLIYEHCPRPLVLHIFLLPTPSSARQAVEEWWERRGALSIVKPSPNDSLSIGCRFQLRISPDSCSPEITPSDVTFTYKNPPTFFEVCLRNPLEDFRMELKTAENRTVWEAVLRQGADYHRTRDHADTPQNPESHTGSSHSGGNSTHTVAPSVSHNQVQRDVNITTHVHVQPSPAINTDG
ncbi:hypothetical protein ACEWY4_008462 [Coilia grayii]|uniref:Uncharacterized protein n=1 Tax=Coilia grayii TaxID=363190 RepID=A0ABD1KAX0_9TELE